MATAKLTDLTIRSLPEGVYFDEKTPGFGILIGKRRKSWLVVRGKGRVRTTIGHYPDLTLADARRKALVALGVGYTPSSGIRFPVARAEFLEKHGKKLRPGSLTQITRNLNRHFHWEKPLDKITHQDVLAAVDVIEAPSQHAHAIKDIRTFFNWCIPRYLTISPCAGIKQPQAKPRERVLTDDEVKRIWNQAGKLGYPIEQITKLLILTGQRRSEITGLRLSWLTNTTITIPSEIAKNKRASTIPLGKLAAQVIQTVPNTGDLLFPRRNGGTRGYDGMGSAKYRLDLSGVEDWVLHDCRRFFATTMQRLGVRLEVTERLLNHQGLSKSGVIGIYQRYHFEPEMREAIARYEQWLDDLLK